MTVSRSVAGGRPRAVGWQRLDESGSVARAGAGVAQQPRHRRAHRLLRPDRGRPALAARPWWSPAPQTRSARTPARSPRSRAAGWSDRRRGGEMRLSHRPRLRRPSTIRRSRSAPAETGARAYARRINRFGRLALCGAICSHRYALWPDRPGAAQRAHAGLHLFQLPRPMAGDARGPRGVARRRRIAVPDDIVDGGIQLFRSATAN